MAPIFVKRYGGMGTLPPVGKALNEYTWKQISDISNGGKAQEYFAVGDEKTVLFAGDLNGSNVNKQVQLQIAGFDCEQDGALEERGGIITFIIKDAVPGLKIDSGYYNTTNAFNESVQTIKAFLPKSLTDVITAVDKRCVRGFTRLAVPNGYNLFPQTSSFKFELFPLSRCEIFGSSGSMEIAYYYGSSPVNVSPSADGKGQYPIFENSSQIKRGDLLGGAGPYEYVTRTPKWPSTFSQTNSSFKPTSYYCVDKNGASGYVDISSGASRSALIGFCV